MIKVKIEGENEKVDEFLKNLKESNFYYSVTNQTGNNPSNISLVMSEEPGNIPGESDFSFRGFIAEWIREGLCSSLKELLHLSDNGKMISFQNMLEYSKVNDFLTTNFGESVEISQMLNRISENNINNFENSRLIVFGRDSDFDDLDDEEEL